MLSYETGNLNDLLGTQLAAVHLQWFQEIALDGPPPGEPGPPEPPAPAPGPGPSKPVAGAKSPAGKKPPAPAPGKGKPAAAKKFYHEHIAPDGRKHTFADAKALNDALSQSFMSQSDYSKKSKVNADYATRLKQREKELETLSESLKKQGEKYASFEKASRTHKPAFDTFSEAILTPPSADGTYDRIMSAMDEKFKGFEEKLTPLSDFKEQQQFDSGRDEVFASLLEELPEMNREEVEQLMDTSAGDPLTLTRMFAYAAAHIKTLQPGSPEQQRSVASAAAAKKKGHLLAGPTATPPDVEYVNIEEARQAGLTDARAQGLT